MTDAQHAALVELATRELAAALPSWVPASEIAAIVVQRALPALLDQLAAWQAVEVEAGEVVIEDDRQP